MKKILFFLLLSFCTGFSWAQCAYTCSNYAVSSITYSTFPAGSTNVTPSFTNPVLGTFADDGSIGPIPIGFSFEYYCNTYSNVYICSNGFITLDYQPLQWPTQYVHPTQSLPSSLEPNGMIAFNMTDLDPGVGGSITYTTVGTAPNRMFIVTFSNVPCFSSSTDLNTGQIVLYETSNLIEIHTKSARPDINQGTLGSTQGIENTTGSIGVTPPGRNATNAWGATADSTAYQFGPYTPAPPNSVTGNTLLCQGEAGSYQASFIVDATSYTWSFPSGWTGTSSISAITATSGAAGNVSVSATYTCGTSVPALINVSVTPAPIVSITSATPNIICAGKTVTFTAGGAVTYTFYPGGINGVSSLTDTPLTTTNYTLSGTSVEGCVSVNSPTVTVTVLETPFVTVNSGTICLGQSFSITPNGAPNYLINGTAGFFNITPQQVGQYSYSVTGTGTNGCVSPEAVSSITVYALPSIGAAATRSAICNKESVTLTATGGASYLWSNAATSVSITVSPSTNTFYTLIGTDAQGCASNATVNLQVKPCTGIGELSYQNRNDVRISPNPAATSFEVKLDNFSEITFIEVYNALGQKVTSQKVVSEVTTFEVKEWKDGMYYLRVKDGESIHTVKIIKQ